LESSITTALAGSPSRKVKSRKKPCSRAPIRFTSARIAWFCSYTKERTVSTPSRNSSSYANCIAGTVVAGPQNERLNNTWVSPVIAFHDR
jgi:hypothetical protein